MAITLYDLAGAEAERRFSPFCWRTKMALAHKGLEVETVPWRFTEKDRLPQPNGGRVPVIVDGGRVVHDSSTISEYLENRYPDRPSLFPAEAGWNNGFHLVLHEPGQCRSGPRNTGSKPLFNPASSVLSCST